MPIPPGALIDIDEETSAELLCRRPAAVAALLRLAMAGGVDTTPADNLRLALDLCDSVVWSDRQLAAFQVRSRTAWGSRMDVQVARHFDEALLPAPKDNLLQEWSMIAGKPLTVNFADDPTVDQFLERLRARHALAVPLYIERRPSGSLQLFRQSDPPFNHEDAVLLAVMSRLLEAQTSWAVVTDHWRQHALTDSLTGLRTRRFFEEELDRELKRSLRRGVSCALLMLDLDAFKLINDRFGHHAGDEVLRQFAGVLTSDMRVIDTVARLGGDEFAAILPETDAAAACFVAARIRDAVRKFEFRVIDDARPLEVRVSIGVALSPQDESQPRLLMEAADLALYQSKHNGRNRISFRHELRRLG